MGLEQHKKSEASEPGKQWYWVFPDGSKTALSSGFWIEGQPADTDGTKNMGAFMRRGNAFGLGNVDAATPIDGYVCQYDLVLKKGQIESSESTQLDPEPMTSTGHPGTKGGSSNVTPNNSIKSDTHNTVPGNNTIVSGNSTLPDTETEEDKELIEAAAQNTTGVKNDTTTGMETTKDASCAEERGAVNGLRNMLKQCSGGMTKIIPGLFVGSLRDACDEDQLRNNRISHVVSVHDLTRSHPVHDKMGVKVMRVRVSDRPESNLAQHISSVNDFVHEARLNKGSVLVHCLAGASRSVTLVVAYLMTTTDCDYWRCMSSVGDRRKCANPNFGFRMQLTKFETQGLDSEKCRMRAKFSTKWDEWFVLDSESLRQSCRPLSDFAALPIVHLSPSKQLGSNPTVSITSDTTKSSNSKLVEDVTTVKIEPTEPQCTVLTPRSSSLDSFVQDIKNLNFIDQYD
uniref:Uncharacterized protein n=1 Tax=Plectus sambesii TaxID=2011161 RepID=A0A914WHH1_9BILA